MAVKRIDQVSGIDDAAVERLRASGVSSAPAFLEAGRTASGRSALAEAAAVDEAIVLRWLQAADLLRIRGIGPEYVRLLHAAGVWTARDLARQQTAALTRLLETVSEREGGRKPPSESVVSDWIQQAFDLPRALEA